VNTSLSETIVVIGASLNPRRYSHLAVSELSAAGYQVVALGNRQGTIGGTGVLTALPHGLKAHTVTLYIRSEHQHFYEAWLTSGAVGRVIFNPGTENAALRRKLETAGIGVLQQCTLVMLSSGVF